MKKINLSKMENIQGGKLTPLTCLKSGFLAVFELSNPTMGITNILTAYACWKSDE